MSSLVSDSNENLLRVNLSKFFTDLEQDIQQALFEYWNDDLKKGQVNLILSVIHEKHQEYYNLIMHHKLNEYRRSKRIGTLLVYNELQKKKQALKAEPVKYDHSRDNLFGTLNYTEQQLANQTFTATEGTLARVDSNINQILVDGYKSGEGISQVSKDITARFDQLRTWEATRIARTEIHGAQNQGIMDSYESLGVEYTQWISAGDDGRTRDSHLELDGEIIPFGGTYSNGLAFPGDTSGDIEEWINCRCSNAPFVMPAGMMAPEGMEQFKEVDLIKVSEVPKPTTTQQPVEPVTAEPTPQQIEDNLTMEEKIKYETTLPRDIKGYRESAEVTFKDDPKLVELFTKKLKDAEKELEYLKQKALGKVKVEVKEFKISSLEDYNLETMKKDIPIKEETFDKLIKWSYKRATKNKIEYGYQFDTSTGKLINKEVRGKKGSVTFTQQGTNIGSMHTHPPVEVDGMDVGGGSFPSKQDLKTYRSQRGADHLLGSPTEVWYVHAEENLNSGILGQREIDAIYTKVYKEVGEKGQKLVREGKLKTDDKSLRKFMDKEIGDGLLREFNTKEWQDKGFYIRRAYR